MFLDLIRFEGTVYLYFISIGSNYSEGDELEKALEDAKTLTEKLKRNKLNKEASELGCRTCTTGRRRTGDGSHDWSRAGKSEAGRVDWLWLVK